MERKQVIDKFLEKGILLQPDALDRALELPPELMDKIIADLAARGVEVARWEDLKPAPISVEGRPSGKIEVTEIIIPQAADSRIDYMKYFQNRFDRLASIIKRKPSFHGSQSIARIRSGKARPVATIGMICDKAALSGGQMSFVIEDGTARARVLVPRSLPAINVARRLMLDEVVGVLGNWDPERKGLVAREIVFPDIEEQGGALAEQRVFAAFLSDLHFGSDDFMAEEFMRFVAWLGGRSDDPHLREIARLTRYVVICGDLVEGGDRLLARYNGLAEMLKQIPDDVLILAIPGEHDAAGILEPQPGFVDEAVKAFSGLKNFQQGSNPCAARLGGVPILLYHGRSLRDWASCLGTEEPCELLREIMIRRHIAPVYGSAVPLAPLGKDPFAIGEVPRILHVGHTHRKCSANYKGVLLVSSPSWKACDGEAGSGTIIVVDLSTLESREINFRR